jgi:hypothetical protein
LTGFAASLPLLAMTGIVAIKNNQRYRRTQERNSARSMLPPLTTTPTRLPAMR